MSENENWEEKPPTEYIIKTTDRQEHYLAFHGSDFYYCLWDFDQDFLRNHIKYNPDNLSEEQIDILEKARDFLYELMGEHGVDFNHIS